MIQYGYRSVSLDPKDELFCMTNSIGFVREHRLVVARAIGRSLERWEQVHHKNGNKLDNRLENIELWKRPQPSGVRHADYHCPGCQCNKESAPQTEKPAFSENAGFSKPSTQDQFGE